MRSKFASFFVFNVYVVSQQIGNKKEQGVPISVQWCHDRGCETQATIITMDENWRWLHNKDGFKNCIGGGWDSTFCPSPDACSKNCAIEGSDPQAYSKAQITSVDNGKGIKLGFPSAPRMYFLEPDGSYKLWKLNNREFSFDVDLSSIPCGGNAALYLVEMPKDGALDGALNTAGSRYGTGYCDAQCPHMRFIPGMGANMESWTKHSAETPDGQWKEIGPEGPRGVCCAEMDIMEANREAMQWTVHSCNIQGAKVCSGERECGNMSAHFPGFCDKAGCGFNPYRMGNPNFYGAGPAYAVDTTRKFTVVTQFVTSDNTDDGPLVEIRQSYVQDGKSIENAQASMDLGGSRSITTNLCDLAADVFNWNKSEPVSRDFNILGGLKSMGQALNRGMVLTLSIWDDDFGRMLWLDGERTSYKEKSQWRGVKRGPCAFDQGNHADLEARNNRAPISVTFSNIKYGNIGTVSKTHFAPSAPPAPATSPRPIGSERHSVLESVHVAPVEPMTTTTSPTTRPRAPPSTVMTTTAQATPVVVAAAPAPAPPLPSLAPPSTSPPASPPAVAVPLPPAVAATIHWSPGCAWIPNDNCVNADKFACECRAQNPKGPCTPCPGSRPKPAQAVAAVHWTQGCEWIPDDDCQDVNAVACGCRAKNPAGPCTPCNPTSSLKAVQGVMARFRTDRNGEYPLYQESSRSCKLAVVGCIVVLFALLIHRVWGRIRRIADDVAVNNDGGDGQFLISLQEAAEVE